MKLNFKYTSLLTTGILVLSTSCIRQEKPKPNVLFIMADQWRGTALGCLGIEPVQTPNLDELASNGVHFVQAASGYPVSSPARAMLMTGMYPHQNNVTTNCNSKTAPYGVELGADVVCWSDVWSTNGYSLGYIGKWHLDAPYQPFVDTYNNRGAVAWNEWCPTNRRHGFEHWIAYGTYDYHLKPMYWKQDAAREDFYYVNKWGPEYETDEAIAYIKNSDHKLRDVSSPFALVVSFNPPHTGYDLVPDKYKAVYNNLNVDQLANEREVSDKGSFEGDYFRKNVADYYACITGVDEQVGRLINALKEEGIYENTIVVFTSDHGDQMGINNCIGKDIYYEASMHIPLIISWPEKLLPRKDELLISLEDLNPTLTALVGLEKSIPSSVQTTNYANVILNKKEVANTFQPYFFVDYTNQKNGIRGMRTQRYTYALEIRDGKVENEILLDRILDPFQHNNVARHQQEETMLFRNKLMQFLDDTNDPFGLNFTDTHINWNFINTHN